MPEAVAQRYAHALADAVLSPGSSLEGSQAVGELRAFRDIMNSSAEMRNVMLSPAIPNSRKRAVVDRLSGVIPLSKLVRNFLFVLVDRRRADSLDEISAAFETELDRRLGFVRAEVTSAIPLNERQQTELQEALSRVAGKNVRCTFAVDPDLIGGVVARIGSTVYDGSVRTQLQSLGERLAS